MFGSISFDTFSKTVEVGYKPFGAEAPWLVRQLRYVTAAIYFVFALCIILVYCSHSFTYSAPDHPWLDAFAKYELFLVLGQWIAAIGLTILAVYVHHMKSVAGISEQTLRCFVLSQAVRLVTHVTQEGFDPQDGTLDYHMYQCAELLILVSGAYVLFKQFTEFPMTRSEETFPETAIYGVAGVAALWFRHSVSTGTGGVWEMFWMFCLWVDSLALLPQILLSKQIGVMEWSVAHYTAMFTAARVFHGIFWVQFMIHASVHIDFFAFAIPVFLNGIATLAFLAGFYQHFQVWRETGHCFGKGGADEGQTFEFESDNEFDQAL